jgi:hypothetical protein
MRFAARLAGRCCNRQQIFNQQRPQGDRFKNEVSQADEILFLNKSCNRAGRFQIPAQQQAVDVVRHYRNPNNRIMEDNSNNEREKKIEVFQHISEHPTPPSSGVVTPFNSIQEWLNFLCTHEHRSEPVSEYKITFSEPPHVLACLVGYNRGVEHGITSTRIVFQPKEHMWFELPKKYRVLTKSRLIEQIHSELREFFTTEHFKKSFLARGYNISTNFQEDIWSL